MTNPIVSKPNEGSDIAKQQGDKFVAHPQYQHFFDEVQEGLNFPTLAAYTVENLTITVSPALLPVLPASANQDVMVVVTDEVDGRVPAISDGTEWRRFKDQAIITT